MGGREGAGGMGREYVAEELWFLFMGLIVIDIL